MLSNKINLTMDWSYKMDGQHFILGFKWVPSSSNQHLNQVVVILWNHNGNHCFSILWLSSIEHCLNTLMYWDWPYQNRWKTLCSRFQIGSLKQHLNFKQVSNDSAIEITLKSVFFNYLTIFNWTLTKNVDESRLAIPELRENTWF